MPPAEKVAWLVCMDARLHPETFLGLEIGDAHVIRNAGGVASDDAIRSLVISSHLLGTREFGVVHHTDCGMRTFTDDDLRNRLKDDLGVDAGDIDFLPFPDLDKSVGDDVEKIRSSPLLQKGTAVCGYVYEVGTGRLREVVPASQTCRASTLPLTYGRSGRRHGRSRMGEARRVTERFYQSFAAADFDATRACFADACITVSPMGGLDPTQHDAFVRALKGGLPDARLEVLRGAEAGDQVFVHGRLRGTHTNDLVSPGGTLPATGNTLDLPFADYFRVVDGRILDRELIWDQAALLGQLTTARQ